MRVLKTLCFTVALALVATACGSSSSNKSATSTTTPKTNPNATLKIGFTDDQYVTSGPTANVGVYPLNMNILETLILLTPDYQLQPLLATSWTLIPPNTWQFKLRQGVTFQNGAPFNAQAVKTGLFDRIAATPGGGTIKAGPNSAMVVDDYTINFTPTVPNLRVPEQIVHPSNSVVAPGTDLTSHPVGTGPFTFVSYTPKENISVTRNDNYWGKKAGVAGMTAQFYPDNNARLLALKAGDIDVAYQINGPDVQGLKTAGFNVETSTVGAYEALYLNIHGIPGKTDILQDVNVRKAIAMSIDRNQLVSGVLDGEATTDQTMIPPQALGQYASTITGFKFDTTQAKALLDQAGWAVGSDGIRTKNGRRLQLTLISGFPSADVHRPIPTFLQAQLKAVGIDLQITEVPDSNSYTAHLQAKDGDMYIEQGNQNDASVGFLPTLLFYTGSATSGSNYQPAFAPGGAFDADIAPTLTEPDHAKLQQEVATAMHELIDNDAVVLPVAGIFRIYGLKKTVQGFQAHPSFLSIRWDGVTVSS